MHVEVVCRGNGRAFLCEKMSKRIKGGNWTCMPKSTMTMSESLERQRMFSDLSSRLRKEGERGKCT